MRIRSLRTVQQMHPLFISNTSSSALTTRCGGQQRTRLGDLRGSANRARNDEGGHGPRYRARESAEDGLYGRACPHRRGEGHQRANPERHRGGMDQHGGPHQPLRRGGAGVTAESDCKTGNGDGKWGKRPRGFCRPRIG
jgi:hypothetical protein